MSLIGQRIRAERTLAGMTQDALAEAIGCSKSQLSLMESGHRTVSAQRAAQIEAALGIADGRLVAALEWQATPPTLRASLEHSQDLADRLRRALRSDQPLEELRRLIDQQDSNVESLRALGRRIPVINNVAAGYPAEFTDLDYPASIADDYISCPDVSDPDAFAARVVGDSMAPDYREGDIVVFSPLLAIVSGSDCFIRLERDSQTTFKRVYFEEGERTIRLQPLNNAYAPRIVDREDVGGMYAAAYVMRRVETSKRPNVES